VFSHVLNPLAIVPPLMAIWDRNVGIGVDVHVHRITKHAQVAQTTYENSRGDQVREIPITISSIDRLAPSHQPIRPLGKRRLNLQSWLPTELHKEINHLLAGFDQACQSRLKLSTSLIDIQNG